MKPRKKPASSAGRSAARPAKNDLERGREAFARGDFAAAFEAFSAADSAGPLAGEDLFRLATAAALLGRDEAGTRAFERAHFAYFEAGNLEHRRVADQLQQVSGRHSDVSAPG